MWDQEIFKRKFVNNLSWWTLKDKTVIVTVAAAVGCPVSSKINPFEAQTLRTSGLAQGVYLFLLIAQQ